MMFQTPLSNTTSGSLKFVVAPASDHALGLDFQKLTSYLSTNIGIAIELIYCDSYAEAINAFRMGAAQLGWLGHYAYHELASEDLIEPFAVGLPKGKDTPNYQSLVLTQITTDLKKLSNLKNIRIAIGDKHSTSGYIVPKDYLSEAGIDLDNVSQFKSVFRVKNHDEALLYLVNGDVDAALVSSVNFEENIKTKKIDPTQIKILYRSGDIPGAPLVYLKTLDAGLKMMVQKHTLNAHHSIEVGGYGGPMERYVEPFEGRKKLLESYLQPQWGWKYHLSIIAFICVIASIMIDLEINPVTVMQNTGHYLFDVIARMYPPDFSDPKALLLSMLETVEMAILGTVLAVTLSIPIGLLSARNIAPNYFVYIICRTITVFFRAVPEFIMAMILVIAIGFGAMPGVIALGFHTMGFLAKFYAEAIEHVRDGPIEAMTTMGANRAQVLAFAIVPQIMTSFVANNMYILDRNIRMATMLGIVGAGGIGYELQSAFRQFEYPRVAAIILIIFVTIFAIDFVSSVIRKKIQ
jgi:phosphonate transport system permease protein